LIFVRSKSHDRKDRAPPFNEVPILEAYDRMKEALDEILALAAAREGSDRWVRNRVVEIIEAALS
jgi:hypothetical protein